MAVTGTSQSPRPLFPSCGPECIGVEPEEAAQNEPGRDCLPARPRSRSVYFPTWIVEAGEIGRYAVDKHRDDDDFVQPRALYRDVMSDSDRDHLVSNIVAHASDRVSDDVQRRVVGYWTNVDPELGARVASGLGRGNGTGSDAQAAQTARSAG